MTPDPGVSFDPDMVRQLEDVLDQAWASLSPRQRERTTKSHVAQRILELAKRGERDPCRLRAYAVLEVLQSGVNP